jgi:hypothetical protein
VAGPSEQIGSQGVEITGVCAFRSRLPNGISCHPVSQQAMSISGESPRGAIRNRRGYATSQKGGQQ